MVRLEMFVAITTVSGPCLQIWQVVMARIRSIHPGIFTDESYMTLSFASRELIKGLWCEADDSGVFDWKPLTLKARIMPADAVDVNALLQELIDGRFVGRFEVGGRIYGAVRNFCKYQHPKKPTYPNPLPDEWRFWVGRADSASTPFPIDHGPNEILQTQHVGTDLESVPDQTGSGGEAVGKRWGSGGEAVFTGVGVGVGEKKEESKQAAILEPITACKILTSEVAAALPVKSDDTISRIFHPDPDSRSSAQIARAEAAPLIAIFDRVRDQFFPDNTRPWPVQTDSQTAAEWMETGKSAGLSEAGIAEIVAQTCERQCRKMRDRNANPPRALGIFRDDVKADLQRAGCAPTPSADVGLSILGTSMDPRWSLRVRGWMKHGRWENSLWGPEPGTTGCQVPAAALVQCGFVLKESAA